MPTPQETVADARRQLAALRAARGEGAPTLGAWFLPTGICQPEGTFMTVQEWLEAD